MTTAEAVPTRDADPGRMYNRITLDPNQRAAAEKKEGPGIIIGGPGSGKTQALLGRIAWLLKQGAPPATITYVTFTARNAEQMRRAIDEATESDGSARQVFIGTFHHYASTYLRVAGAVRVGRHGDYTVWDRDDTHSVLDQILKEQREDFGVEPVDIKKAIDWHSLNRARHKNDPLDPRQPEWAELIRRYEDQKLAQNAMDFDDLIPLAAAALAEDHTTRTTWSRIRSRHLLIDEFQDMTQSQFALMQQMVGPTRSLTVATDPNQSIYSWRGADRRLLEYFMQEYGMPPVQMLTINHRATSTLVEMAADLVGNPNTSGLENHPQTPVRPAGKPPATIEVKGNFDTIAAELTDMIIRKTSEEEIAYEDMAVIFRQKRSVEALRVLLARYHVPYHLLGEKKKDSTAAMRIINLMAFTLNPFDANAFQKASDPLGKPNRATINERETKRIVAEANENEESILDAARQYLPRLNRQARNGEALEFIIRTADRLRKMLSNDETFLPDVVATTIRQMAVQTEEKLDEGLNPATTEILAQARAHQRRTDETLAGQLTRYLEEIKASTHPDLMDTATQEPEEMNRGVSIGSIYQAKGLQWRVVWFIDACKQHIPGNAGPDRIGEEERLFYVAATRAQDQLYLCTASGMSKDPEATITPFIDYIANHLVREKLG